MAGILDITLERDGHDQPWGFRLQGGNDVGMPLSIQRILVGTPSEGVLKKGDVLLRISKTDAKGLSHQQAADLFTNTGNQITIQVKRTGVPQHTANATSTSVAPPQIVPVSGGIPLPGMTTVSTAKSRDTLQLNLPQSRVGIKPQSSANQHPTTTPLSLTIQNQPYRTSPLIQPSVKVELGPGSSQHLKMQSDYLTGAKDPLPPKDPRAIEFTMKQKVRGNTTLFQISLIGSEGKPWGLENNKTSSIGMRCPMWKDMLKTPSSRNRKISDLDKPKKIKFGENLLKKKSYKDLDVDENNNFFKIGGEAIKLKKVAVKPKKPVEPFRLPERKPLRRVDPKLLIKKKPKPLQVPKEYQDEQIPEYDRTELKDLNFVVEKAVLETYEKSVSTTKRKKREKYVKEQLKQFKPDAPKEKKKKPEPVVVKKPWKREVKPEPVKKDVPQPKTFKCKARPIVVTKAKRYIKFEVKTTRREDYLDEITLLNPKDEILKYKGKEDQEVTFTINLNAPRKISAAVDNSNCESIDVFQTINI